MMDVDARVLQLVSELRVKVGSVILRARSGGMGNNMGASGSYSCSSSASSSPGFASSFGTSSGSGVLGGTPDVKRWFNIECAEPDGLREELSAQEQQWRAETGAAFPPLCIEVRVAVPSSSSSSSPGPPSAGIETSESGGGAGSGSGAAAVGGGGGDAPQHRVELWVMRFEPTASASSSSSSSSSGVGGGGAASAAGAVAAMETPAMYKRAVILVRTLYSLLRFLPGHKIVSLHDASVGVHVSSRLLSVEESLRVLETYPMAAATTPATSTSTAAVAAAAAHLGSPTSSSSSSSFYAQGHGGSSSAAPTTSHAGNTFFTFGALDTPAGRVHTGVMYDAHRADVVIEAFRHYAPSKDIVNRPKRVLSAPAARPLNVGSYIGRRQTVGGGAGFVASAVHATDASLPVPGARAKSNTTDPRGMSLTQFRSASQPTTIVGFAPQSAPTNATGGIIVKSSTMDVSTPVSTTRTRRDHAGQHHQHSHHYQSHYVGHASQHHHHTPHHHYGASGGSASISGSDSASESFTTNSPPLPFSETPQSSHSLLFAVREENLAAIDLAPPLRSPVVSSSFLEAAASNTFAGGMGMLQKLQTPVQVPVQQQDIISLHQREQEEQRNRLRITYKPSTSPESGGETGTGTRESAPPSAGASALSSSRHSARGDLHFDDDNDLPFALESEHAHDLVPPRQDSSAPDALHATAPGGDTGRLLGRASGSGHSPRHPSVTAAATSTTTTTATMMAAKPTTTVVHGSAEQQRRQQKQLGFVVSSSPNSDRGGGGATTAAAAATAKVAAAAAQSSSSPSPQDMLRLVNDAYVLKSASEGMPLRYAMHRIEQLARGVNEQ